jgi:hypothetical protein
MALVYRQLPVLDTVKGSFRLAAAQAPKLILPLGVFAAICVVLFASANLISESHLPIVPRAPLVLALLALFGAVTVSFVVGTHRLVLLPETPRDMGFFAFDTASLKYMALSIAIIVTQILSFVVAGALVKPLGVIGLGVEILVLMFVVIRLYFRTPLMFAAIAIGEPNARLRDCWDQMYGNAVGFLFGAFLITLPAGLLGWAFDRSVLGISQIIALPIGIIVYTATVFVSAIYVSLSYDLLVRQAETAQAPAAA